MIIAMKKTFLNSYHYFFDANGNLNPRCDVEERKSFREVFNLRREVLEEMLPVVYSEVFDEQGNVKACGREKCLELIEICSELDPFNYYGDSKQGFLNEENIFKLRNA